MSKGPLTAGGDASSNYVIPKAFRPTEFYAKLNLIMLREFPSGIALKLSHFFTFRFRLKPCHVNNDYSVPTFNHQARAI